MHRNDDERMRAGPKIELPPMTRREKIEAIIAGLLGACVFWFFWSFVP